MSKNISTIVIAFVAGLLVAGALFLFGGDSDWDYYWYDDRPPLSEFKQKCELRKAFRIYRNHEGVWSCKLEDGRVMTEKDFRRFLNN